MVVYVAAASL